MDNKEYLDLNSLKLIFEQKNDNPKFLDLKSVFCGKCDTLYYVEKQKYPLITTSMQATDICPKCGQKKEEELKGYNAHLFTLNFLNHIFHFYHHVTTIVVTDGTGTAIGKYIKDSELKKYDRLRELKMSTTHLIILEKFLKELPFRLKMWRYYNHNQNVHCFNGFEYISTNNPEIYETISTIDLTQICYPAEISFVYNEIKSIKPLKSVEHVKPIANYNNEVFTIDVDSQAIFYNAKNIAFYNFLKKKKIVISWMNDITVDELDVKPNEIINALKEFYFDHQIAFYNEKDLV